jgi:hypothetical protein
MFFVFVKSDEGTAKKQAAHTAILDKRHHQHHWLTGLKKQSESQNKTIKR